MVSNFIRSKRWIAYPAFRRGLFTPPHTRQPGLRAQWRSAGPVITLDFYEGRRRSEIPPAFGGMKHAIASVAPPFLVEPMRNGAEQNASIL